MINSKVVFFCHLKELVRPETFGPYYVCLSLMAPIFLFRGLKIYKFRKEFFFLGCLAVVLNLKRAFENLATYCTVTKGCHIPQYSCHHKTAVLKVICVVTQLNLIIPLGLLDFEPKANVFLHQNLNVLSSFTKDFQEVGWEGIGWIDLAQDIDR